MCSSKPPKIPDPVPPPAPPPAPTPVARKVANKVLKKRRQGSSSSATRKSGTSALTVRRSTVNTGSSGSGANISY